MASLSHEVTTSSWLHHEAPAPVNNLHIEVGSLDSPRHVRQAVDIVKDGGAFVFEIRGVFGLAFNGANPASKDLVLATKGDANQNKPFSGMNSSEFALSLVDKDRVDPRIATLMQVPKKYSEIFGGICHVRLPVHPKAVDLIPPSMRSLKDDGVTYMHNLDMHGHPIDQLVKELEKNDIRWIAVTTLNKHGSPEITNLDEAKAYLGLPHNQNVDLILTDPIPTRKGILGSFPIADVSKRPDGKLTGIREGHIPNQVVERILGIEIDWSTATKAAYRQIDFSPILEEDVTPQELRMLAIGFMAQYTS